MFSGGIFQSQIAAPWWNVWHIEITKNTAITFMELTPFITGKSLVEQAASTDPTVFGSSMSFQLPESHCTLFGLEDDYQGQRKKVKTLSLFRCRLCQICHYLPGGRGKLRRLFHDLKGRDWHYAVRKPFYEKAFSIRIDSNGGAFRGIQRRYVVWDKNPSFKSLMFFLQINLTWSYKYKDCCQPS